MTTISYLEQAGVATVGRDAGDAYEELRPSFNRRLTGRPALIVLPEDVARCASSQEDPDLFWGLRAAARRDSRGGFVSTPTGCSVE